MLRLLDKGTVESACQPRRDYSPGWGNCVVEADERVAQAVHDELRSADHVISGAGALYILMRRLDAKIENLGDLPVGLSCGEQA